MAAQAAAVAVERDQIHPTVHPGCQHHLRGGLLVCRSGHQRSPLPAFDASAFEIELETKTPPDGGVHVIILLDNI